MIRHSLFLAASALVLAACTSAPVSEPLPGDPSATLPVPADKPAALSEFQLALQTADDLAAKGNVPTAIQRLMVLVGSTKISKAEKAETLLRLGTLSLGDTGYDAKGAVKYLQEVVTGFADTPSYATAVPLLAQAKTKVAMLEGIVANTSSTRGQQFDALMRLGRHDDAVDLMTRYNLAVGNEALLAMSQFGYLCDDAALAGKVYSVIDRDGTGRDLRFCDLGK